MLSKMICENQNFFLCFLFLIFLKSTLMLKYQYKLMYFIFYSHWEWRTEKNPLSMVQNVSCLTFHSATESQRTSHISAPWTGESSQLHSVYNTNRKVCVCVVMVTRNLN